MHSENIRKAREAAAVPSSEKPRSNHKSDQTSSNPPSLPPFPSIAGFKFRGSRRKHHRREERERLESMGERERNEGGGEVTGKRCISYVPEAKSPPSLPRSFLALGVLYARWTVSFLGGRTAEGIHITRESEQERQRLREETSTTTLRHPEANPKLSSPVR